jgi:serpin B
MMTETMNLPYCADEQYEALELPYGNGSFSMVVVLPKTNVSVENLVANMNADTWNTMLNRMDTVYNLAVRLPRFKIEYKKTLNNDLMALGMTSMFSPVAANLSEINADEPLYVSFVLQKTFADVNEEGTEAAAVTVIEIATTSALNLSFVANRPFLYFIKEKTTGAILFSGINRKL